MTTHNLAMQLTSNCANCRFQSIPFTWCLRYPPTEYRKYTDAVLTTGFPRVVENGQCGEWQPERPYIDTAVI